MVVGGGGFVEVVRCLFFLSRSQFDEVFVV